MEINVPDTHVKRTKKTTKQQLVDECYKPFVKFTFVSLQFVKLIYRKPQI